MTNSGEVPDLGFAMPLDAREVEVLRDNIVFPAVNYLTHDAFTEGDPESRFLLERVFVKGEEPAVRVALEAYVWLCYLDDDDMDIDPPERHVTVDIAVQYQRPDLTEELMNVAKEQDGDEAGLAGDKLSAWAAYNYYVSTNPSDNGIRESSLQLQDEEGVDVWSEKEACLNGTGGPDGPIELTEEERAALDVMDEQESVIEIADRMRIREALGRLGVPAAILKGQGS